MGNIYHYTGFIIIWALATAASFFIGYFAMMLLHRIYKRTYLHYAIETFIAWYNWDFKKDRKHDDANYYQLMAFRQNRHINRMPAMFKNYWFKIIDYRIQELREDIIAHGEVPPF